MQLMVKFLIMEFSVSQQKLQSINRAYLKNGNKDRISHSVNQEN
ncbi:hypothetical protein BA1DRAFT_04143 [Photorhabdus aegyptia]|uniref:Uncharacterized protein n=1 Tax=Photorhabdus aegyptia TaxID=2805098 RepID=A0A022PFY6_9GAMM|nr:hypothetical protein BA1DRAFT_04143 [Photorhabdus aegyptia]